MQKIVVFLFLLIFSANFSSKAIAPIVYSISFETWENNEPTGWKIIDNSLNAIQENNITHSGNFALGLMTQTTTLEELIIETLLIDADQRKTYNVSIWVYDTKSEAHITLLLSYYGSNEKYLGILESSASSDFNGWQILSIQQKAPDDTLSLRAKIVYFGQSIDELIIVDDFIVEELLLETDLLLVISPYLFIIGLIIAFILTLLGRNKKRN